MLLMKYLRIASLLFLFYMISGSALEGNENQGKQSSNVPLGEEILTPAPGPQPRINGPLVYGCSPGKPFIYRIPCQGTRPINFSVKGLPSGLNLDPATGIITGTTPQKGEYKLLITAINKNGRDKRSFTIIAGDKLALTPPMGYNHWYAHYTRITDKMMREAADILISSGMADVGYDYVNIDDCWMNAPEHKQDPSREGPLRDDNGNILANVHFPDMKALTDYIHAKGLKAGIYSSPGKLTCAKFAASYGYEEQDARQFAEWGFDFLKYDWCSYRLIAAEESNQVDSQGKKIISLEQHKKPYKLMGDILKKQDRDILYNLCQYGMADVWKWGAEVGAHSWRTARDLGYDLDKVFDVALRNSELGEYSKPGEWNDPDYLQIGWVGPARLGRYLPEKVDMAPSTQYAYMSLWSLMASPLFFSGDMTKLDPFTLNILCNPEIIEVNQDPLGISGEVIKRNEEQFVMIKKLHDGTFAVGLFNMGKDPSEVTINFSEIKLTGKLEVRDLWRQTDMGRFTGKFSSQVPAQGVVMLKIGKK
jgi:alpha-galactosidase